MYVYLLECEDSTIYTGITYNLKRRFMEHKLGVGSNYTKKHGANKYIHIEIHPSKQSALQRERQIKSWNHKSKIDLSKGVLLRPTIIRERVDGNKEWRKLNNFERFIRNEAVFVKPPKDLFEYNLA